MKGESKLIISVKEGRKKLPAKLNKQLSDDEVEHLIIRLESIAREFIQTSVPKVSQTAE